MDCHTQSRALELSSEKRSPRLWETRPELSVMVHFLLPMDECLVLSAVDLCGRPYLSWDAEFTVPRLGDMDTEMAKEFFYAVSYAAAMNLHLKVLTPGNNHHMMEAMFKAFGKALDMAVSRKAGQQKFFPRKGVYNYDTEKNSSMYFFERRQSSDGFFR